MAHRRARRARRARAVQVRNSQKRDAHSSRPSPVRPSVPCSNALKYSNQGGSPDIAGAWIEVGGAYSSFEFPTGSFRTWVDVDAAKGLIIEQVRYESWECTEVPGQSLVEMTNVEILVNGTAITDTLCLLLTVSEDLQTSNQLYFSCDEEPARDWFGYTNARVNSTVAAAPSGLTCTGSPVSLDTLTAGGPSYEGPGSATKETTSLGDVFPPFESVNPNGYPDYRGAGGNPFSQGLYVSKPRPSPMPRLAHSLAHYRLSSLQVLY